MNWLNSLSAAFKDAYCPEPPAGTALRLLRRRRLKLLRSSKRE